MRPGSGRLNTGAVPGTGMRPGSGRRPPGTSRLRTGVVGTPSGAGTQAAQGVALNASINVTDRPMTGQGVMGMRTAGGGGRLVEDTSYYVGLLRRKMTEVNRETQRLKDELDQSSKDSSQTTALEQKYDKLLKQKELLEGQLADYNLAMDKVRASLVIIIALILTGAVTMPSTNIYLLALFSLFPYFESNDRHVLPPTLKMYKV